jgi:hypothetical protein
MAELSDKGAKYFWFLVFPILAISSYLSQAWLAIWGFIALCISIYLTFIGE